MTDEEKDVKIKKLLMAYDWRELKELREDCGEIRESSHLGECAERLRLIAEHELADHQCAGAYLYLRAVAERLEWFHSHVLKLQEAEKKLQVIH